MDGQSGGRRGGRLDAGPGAPRGERPGRPRRLDGRVNGSGARAAGARGGDGAGGNARGGPGGPGGSGGPGDRSGGRSGGRLGGGLSAGGAGRPGGGGRSGAPRGGPGRTPDGRPPGKPGRPGGGASGTRRGPGALLAAVRRLPQPRLTGLGGGLFAASAMLLVGCLDRLLFDGSPLVYGLLFLPVSAATALWVRGADLVTAPISVPIAFAVGVMPIAGGEGGFGGHAMALVTALAVHAGWLYGGTLVAGLITCVRKVRLMGRRQRAAAAAAARATAQRRP